MSHPAVEAPACSRRLLDSRFDLSDLGVTAAAGFGIGGSAVCSSRCSIPSFSSRGLLLSASAQSSSDMCVSMARSRNESVIVQSACLSENAGRGLF